VLSSEVACCISGYSLKTPAKCITAFLLKNPGKIDQNYLAKLNTFTGQTILIFIFCKFPL